jgi:hypothetical protein
MLCTHVILCGQLAAALTGCCLLQCCFCCQHFRECWTAGDPLSHRAGPAKMLAAAVVDGFAL